MTMTSGHPKRHRGSFDKQQEKFHINTYKSDGVPASTKKEAPAAAARMLIQMVVRLYYKHRSSNTISNNSKQSFLPRKLDNEWTDAKGVDEEDSRAFSEIESLGLFHALWQRCVQLDQCCLGDNKKEMERQLLLKPSFDSGYTPLHQAIYHGDLVQILLILRCASGTDRMTRRPMDLLYSYNYPQGSGTNIASATGTTSTKTTTNINHTTSDTELFAPTATKTTGNNNSTILQDITTAKDYEGLTPAALLANLQRRELAACRSFLLTALQRQQQQNRATADAARSRSRSNSLFEELSDITHDNNDQGDGDGHGHEFALSSNDQIDENDRMVTTYGCEVVTFGRAHHCALGVVASNRGSTPGGNATVSQDSSSKQHPQRVQAFAQDIVGRTGSAIAVASATFHTLTLTRSGELYAFGLGKSGRLGTGDEKPRATPVRVMGPLSTQTVVAVAAAENHSLCVTSNGHVYAFGSNRFGQLGMASNANETSASRCLPRRVNELKHVFLTSVAAGLSHSVALSNNGEVYVWGDNSAGQLGMHSRGGGGSSGGGGNDNAHHKPQRVEALWRHTPYGPKIAISIAASEESILVITSGSGQKGLPINSVYVWGNGNHVPFKVQFGSQSSTGRAINPVAVSCARYHKVVVTSEGEVYTWGLHADSLGTNSRSSRNRSVSDADKCDDFNPTGAISSSALSLPQLVTGMLPENGGGNVVAVSASENHTAVVTEDGHLWTWGDTNKKYVLGHEGVRWQPVPKRVPGVHRAVAVSAAKEHTVLLIGASFPPVPTGQSGKNGSVPSLETIAASAIARHCDLFNVLPILITAERTQTTLLLEYCKHFVRLNCDGILNVGQKSAIDCYLNEQLDGCSLMTSRQENYRDERYQPIVRDVVIAGRRDAMEFGHERLGCSESWLQACELLLRQPVISDMVARYELNLTDTFRASFAIPSKAVATDQRRPRQNSVSSERCDELTTAMDLSSIVLAESKLASLNKEARAVRKRLSQIAKIESCDNMSTCVTAEQQHKIARGPQLKLNLLQLDDAILIVHAAIRHLGFIETKAKLANMCDYEDVSKDEEAKDEIAPSEESCSPMISIKTSQLRCNSPMISIKTSQLRCEICKITCPDETSHALHISGRKHRNRLSQVIEEDKRQTAATIIEDQRRALLMLSMAHPVASLVEPVHSPWGKATSKPKYSLPPPPHPIVDIVTQPLPRKKNLLDIMEEESRQASVLLVPSMEPKKLLLQLPPGSAPPLKSPPWVKSTYASSIPTSSPVQSQASCPFAPQNSPFLLGDFIKQQSPSREVTITRPSLGWSSPRPTFQMEERSFREIQEQELDFETKKDQSFSPNGKWFIERRERAGSLTNIQCETYKTDEKQRLVDEQIAIERQIEIETEARKNAEATRLNQKKRAKAKNKSGKGLDQNTDSHCLNSRNSIKPKGQHRFKQILNEKGSISNKDID